MKFLKPYRIFEIQSNDLLNVDFLKIIDRLQIFVDDNFCNCEINDNYAEYNFHINDELYHEAKSKLLNSKLNYWIPLDFENIILVYSKNFRDYLIDKINSCVKISDDTYNNHFTYKKDNEAIFIDNKLKKKFSINNVFYYELMDYLKIYHYRHLNFIIKDILASHVNFGKNYSVDLI